MNLVTSIALAILGGIFAALAAFGGIRAAWRGLGRRRGVSAALAAFAVVATICAQKPSGPAITVDALLRDAGCYATNDVFHAAVSNAPAYAAIDFSACPMLVYARERGQTNAADWAELTPRRTFSELPADYAIVNATNYNYLVYLNYVPPSPVHTNGVFELHGFMVPGDDPGNLEQLAAGFINSHTYLPPPTARDYIQDGLVAMWDGIENAGLGIHSSTPSKWVDLTGNGYDIKLNTGLTISEDSISAVSRWIGYYGAQIGFTSMSVCVRLRATNQSRMVAQPAGEANFVYFEFRPSDLKLGISQRGRDINNYVGIDIDPSMLGSRASLHANYGKSGSRFGAYECYLNGVAQTLKSGSGYPYNNAGTNFAVGSRIQGSSTPSGSFNTGADVCRIALYSRALTPEEIQHNYEIDKRRFNLP